jgi:hypothetical protein
MSDLRERERLFSFTECPDCFVVAAEGLFSFCILFPVTSSL